MKSYQAADEQFNTILGCFGQGLMKEKSVAYGTIKHSVKNMCQSFALVHHVRGKSYPAPKDMKNNVQLGSEIC